MEFNSFKHQKKLIVILSILLISGFVISNFVYFCTARASLHREIRDKILPITIERINAELCCEMFNALKHASIQADIVSRRLRTPGETSTLPLPDLTMTGDVNYSGNIIPASAATVHENNNNSSKHKCAWDAPTSHIRLEAEPDANHALIVIVEHKLDSNNERKDALLLQLKWRPQNIKEVIDSYYYRCGRHIMLLDRNGRILMHNLPAGSNPKTIKEITGLAAAAGELASGSDFDLRFQEGFHTTFSSARFNPALNIYVLAQQSDRRATANIIKALIGNLIFSILITAIAVFITNMTLNMYVKKIKTLSIIDSELKNINQSQQQEIRAQHRKLLEKNKSLEKALSDVKQLSGLLPICANCKKVRDNKGYWEQLESYISSHSTTEFSHGLCPDCAKKLYPDIFKSDEYYYEKHPRKE